MARDGTAGNFEPCAGPGKPDSLLGASCGAAAIGPHPNPEIGYREPLCITHVREACAEWTPSAEDRAWAEQFTGNCTHPGNLVGTTYACRLCNIRRALQAEREREADA